KAGLGTVGFRGILSIMRSNGGVMTPDIATQRPAAMMESGPVGGIIASARLGRSLGFANVISFDMGGTTAKASLIRDGEPTMAPGYYVGGYASGHPVMLPMIDVVEVDAGAAAQAIVDIAIAKMSLAVREVSVAKGYDPRDFALVASGGAGPLHVLAIARELHVPKVVVPLFPSHFSALGMLLADERHD